MSSHRDRYVIVDVDCGFYVPCGVNGKRVDPFSAKERPWEGSEGFEHSIGLVVE